MQIFSVDATIFLKKYQEFFCPQNIEKLPLKVGHNHTRPRLVRHLILLQAHECSLLIMGLYIFEIKLC